VVGVAAGCVVERGAAFEVAAWVVWVCPDGAPPFAGCVVLVATELTLATLP
jgi:hypothetical protein